MLIQQTHSCNNQGQSCVREKCDVRACPEYTRPLLEPTDVEDTVRRPRLRPRRAQAATASTTSKARNGEPREQAELYLKDV